MSVTMTSAPTEPALGQWLPPAVAPRRLRSTAAVRRLVREHWLHPADLVLPLFVRDGLDAPRDIPSMPGVRQHTLDSFRAALHRAAAASVGAVMLFGIPREEDKDALGRAAENLGGVLNRAIAVAREEVGGDLVIMSDLCIDEFTVHGHCGVLDALGRVDNARTLERYAQIGVAQARAGADLVGLSGMMDHQVASVRAALDLAGHGSVGITAYAAKYASAAYGPFRDAVCCSLTGDRRTYQMDPANRREARREIRLDLAEGADMVIVKPASTYLDVVAMARGLSDVPVAAYQVSGEYSMVEAAAARGWIDRNRMILESLLGIRRAGADVIVTYWATEVSEWLVAGREADRSRQSTSRATGVDR